MSESPRIRRPSGGMAYLKVLLLCVGLGALAGMSGALLRAFAGVPGLWISSLLMVAAMAVGIGFSVWWWRNLDEAAQEAHKWAWFWGGSAGMALGLSLLIAATTRGETFDALLQGADASDLVMAGVGLLLGCQMIGYGVAWAFWWLRRR